MLVSQSSETAALFSGVVIPLLNDTIAREREKGPGADSNVTGCAECNYFGIEYIQSGCTVRSGSAFHEQFIFIKMHPKSRQRRERKGDRICREEKEGQEIYIVISCPKDICNCSRPGNT